MDDSCAHNYKGKAKHILRVGVAAPTFFRALKGPAAAAASGVADLLSTAALEAD
jgi:hypothetical protein